MNKELILLDDVAGLGKIGEIVKVAPGYARNFLLPKHLAQPVNKGTLRQVEARKIKLQKEYEARVEIAKALAAKIESLQIVIPMIAGENDKLFGSVSAQNLVDAMKEQGVEVDKSAIALENNLKDLGDAEVAIKLGNEVTATLKVKITKKEEA